MTEKIFIDVKTQQVQVSFNHLLYSEQCIVQALEDFKSVCSFKKEQGKIILKPHDNEDLALLGYELYNYVLGLMKN